jgi:hypothetical protein
MALAVLLAGATGSRRFDNPDRTPEPPKHTDGIVSHPPRLTDWGNRLRSPKWLTSSQRSPPVQEATAPGHQPEKRILFARVYEYLSSKWVFILGFDLQQTFGAVPDCRSRLVMFALLPS